MTAITRGAPLRVALFGTESTGKSSLAEELARHYRVPWSREYVRQFWDEHAGRIMAEDLAAIARGQIACEDAAVAQADALVFHDTELVTNVLWADWLFPGACPAWVREAAEQRSRGIALYLLCEDDLPFAPDPQRVFVDPARRKASAEYCRRELERRGLPWVAVSGSGAERNAVAINAVNSLLIGRK